MNEYFYFTEGQKGNVIYRTSGVVTAENGTLGYETAVRECHLYFGGMKLTGPEFTFSILRFNKL